MVPRSTLAVRRCVCQLAGLALVVTACQSPQDSLSPSLALTQPSKALTVVGSGTGAASSLPRPTGKPPTSPA
jgi:hypothetical protein